MNSIKNKKYKYNKKNKKNYLDDKMACATKENKKITFNVKYI